MPDLCVCCRKPTGSDDGFRLDAFGESHGWCHHECARRKNEELRNTPIQEQNKVTHNLSYGAVACIYARFNRP